MGKTTHWFDYICFVITEISLTVRLFGCFGASKK